MFVQNYQEIPSNFFLWWNKNKEFLEIVSLTHTETVKNKTKHFFLANFERQCYHFIENFDIFLQKRIEVNNIF